MKLELKHLAPYLPYKLKVWNDYSGQQETLISCNSDMVICFGRLVTMADEYDYSEIKPILNPLSDLTKTIIPFDMGSYTMEAWLNGNWDLGRLDWVLKDEAKEQRSERIFDLPYSIFPVLFQYHFDVFELIEAGLAIDINKIS